MCLHSAFSVDVNSCSPNGYHTIWRFLLLLNNSPPPRISKLSKTLKLLLLFRINDPKVIILLSHWIFVVKTANHNRDFDLEVTLRASGSDLVWCKNEGNESWRHSEPGVHSAPRCPCHCFINGAVDLDLQLLRGRVQGEHSSAVVGLWSSVLFIVWGQLWLQTALRYFPDENLTDSRPVGWVCVLTNDLTKGAHEEGAGGWERGQLFPGECLRQPEDCKVTHEHITF